MRLVVAVPDQVEPDPDSAELRKQSHATRIYYKRLMRDRYILSTDSLQRATYVGGSPTKDKFYDEVPG